MFERENVSLPSNLSLSNGNSIDIVDLLVKTNTIAHGLVKITEQSNQAKKMYHQTMFLGTVPRLLARTSTLLGYNTLNEPINKQEKGNNSEPRMEPPNFDGDNEKFKNHISYQLLQEIQKLKEEIEILKKEKFQKKNFKKETLHDLIAQNNIPQCLKTLESHKYNFTHDITKTFIMIKADWNHLKLKEIQGISDDSISQNHINKIRYKLLEFIDLLNFEDIE